MPQAKFCVTINEKQTESALDAINRAGPHADLVEIRADAIQDLNVARLLAHKGRPVIFTCRPARHGGGFHGDERKRIDLLIAAAEQGADYVDVEDDADYVRVCANKKNAKVILSYHNFDQTPGDLKGKYTKLISTPADLVKIATYANRLEDALDIIELLDYHGSKQKPLIALSMGERGFFTRILGSRYGSFLTYVASDSGKQTAAGQTTLEEAIHLYRIKRIDDETQVIGLLGTPLGHSLSHVVHNAAFAALKLNWLYLPLDTDDLNAFFELTERIPLIGFSVTVPYKIAVMKYLDQITGDASAIGAVNTVSVRDGKRFGCNTDFMGFIRPLEERMTVAGRRILVLGAGGAARAVVYALRERGADITAANRTLEKAEELAREFNAHHARLSAIETIDCDALINTTAVGMYPHVNESLVPRRYLKNKLVYDLVYNPLKTKLLREAEECGCPTISGIEMFVNQAATQFKIWTGLEAPIDLMRAAALERLS